MLDNIGGKMSEIKYQPQREREVWRACDSLYEEGFKVKVIIPKALRGFYKPIEKNITYIEQLELMPR